MTPQVVRAVAYTILCCSVAAYFVLRWNQRRDRQENAEARMTGIAPPGHLDLQAAPLDDREETALAGIVAATIRRETIGVRMPEWWDG